MTRYHKLENHQERLLRVCRLFLVSLNKTSDRIAKDKELPRGPVAQAQYDRAVQLIRRIDRISCLEERSHRTKHKKRDRPVPPRKADPS